MERSRIADLSHGTVFISIPAGRQNGDKETESFSRFFIHIKIAGFPTFSFLSASSAVGYSSFS